MPILPANEQIGSPVGAAVQKVGVLPVTTGTDNLFTITGNVQLVSILGEVTSDDISEAAAADVTIKLQLDPTGALGATDMCGGLDVLTDTINQLYTITGVPGNAMVVSVTGLAIASYATNTQIILPGTILLDVVEGAGGTGAIAGEITWTVVYYPLELGAYIEAAA